MKNLKLVTLALVIMGVVNLEAGHAINNNGNQASKMRPTRQSAKAVVHSPEAAVEMPKKTLEEQHMVVPFNQRQAMALKGYRQEILQAIADALHGLVQESNGNLTIAQPDMVKESRLFVFKDAAQNNQPIYVHYTPIKPVKMINNEPEFINKMHQKFNELANKYKEFGLRLETIGGRPPVNWVAWYETDMAHKLMGAPKAYLILGEKKPDESQVKAFEEKCPVIIHCPEDQPA